MMQLFWQVTYPATMADGSALKNFSERKVWVTVVGQKYNVFWFSERFLCTTSKWQNLVHCGTVRAHTQSRRNTKNSCYDRGGYLYDTPCMLPLSSLLLAHTIFQMVEVSMIEHDKLKNTCGNNMLAGHDWFSCGIWRSATFVRCQA